MMRALRMAFESDGPVKVSKPTLHALKKRGLVDVEWRLTNSGKLEVVDRIDLEGQCGELELPLVDINTDPTESPERTAFEHFVGQGYKGAFCEGGAILTVLKAACLDTLESLNPFLSRMDARTRFLEAQFTILQHHKEEILTAIRDVSRNKFLSNFSEIISEPFINDCYPGLTVAFAASFFEAVPRVLLAKVAEIFYRNPYVYRAGWPDITMVKEREVEFVEVKTTDKLHRSQLLTILAFQGLFPGKFKVVRLRCMC